MEEMDKFDKRLKNSRLKVLGITIFTLVALATSVSIFAFNISKDIKYAEDMRIASENIDTSDVINTIYHYDTTRTEVVDTVYKKSNIRSTKFQQLSSGDMVNGMTETAEKFFIDRYSIPELAKREFEFDHYIKYDTTMNVIRSIKLLTVAFIKDSVSTREKMIEFDFSPLDDYELKNYVWIID